MDKAHEQLRAETDRSTAYESKLDVRDENIQGQIDKRNKERADERQAEIELVGRDLKGEKWLNLEK